LGPGVAPWGFLDVAVIAVVLYGLNIVGMITAASLLDVRGEPSQLDSSQWLALVVGGSVGSLVGLVLSIVWLRRAAHAQWSDFGVTSAHWLSGVRSGLTAFLIVMVPIFALQWGLNALYQYWIGDPPQHPFIERLLRDSSGAAFVAAAFTAVIVAPLTEEFLFRAVLQGWLERLVVRDANASVGSAWAENAAASQTAPADQGEEATVEARRLRMLPVVVSSAVFAGMHYSHGVAWIPLFFFALALGYLYQRSRSLVAPIVLHMSLNASSMTMLWLSTFGERVA
jgi:membrane protease YdiL (CAAX protease family)